MALTLSSSPLSFEDLEKIIREKPLLEISPEILAELKKTEKGPDSERAALAEAYIAAHTIGFGPEVPEPIIRLALAIQLSFLLRATGSGAQASTLNRLLAFYNRDIFPFVQERASDKSQLAQLCLPLFGLGKVSYQGYGLDAANILEIFSWDKISVSPPEASALLNQHTFAYSVLANAIIQLKPLLPWLAYLNQTFEQICPSATEAGCNKIDLNANLSAVVEEINKGLAAPAEDNNSDGAVSEINNVFLNLTQFTNILAAYTAEIFDNLVQTSEPPATSSFTIATDLAKILKNQNVLYKHQFNIKIKIFTPALPDAINRQLLLAEQILALGFWSISQVGKVFNMASENLTLAAYYHSEFYVPTETVQQQLAKTSNFIRTTIPTP